MSHVKPYLRFLVYPALTCMLLLALGPAAHGQSVSMSGELKRWHKVTLTLDGPSTSEGSTPNPFADYRMLVTFNHADSGVTYVVPGYFAADGNAANSSATTGNKWRAHVSPDETGTWTYVISFRTGTDVAIDSSPTAGSALAPYDGVNGNFAVTETDKAGRDHRGMGRLEYVNKHHLQFQGSGEFFLKAGADSPENFLAYDDFDNTPNVAGRRKSWSPHAGDYDATDASAYLWKGTLGSEMLGAVRYLSGKGMNVFSFLSFSLAGDDDNVFPHLLKVSIPVYEGYNDAQRWDLGVHHDRFDVSKMDQWERIFEYADKKGMYLHFKMQEQENDQKMDGGNVGRERKLYYRELIARFAHHLALNWNAGEENTQTDQQRKDMAQYFYDTDPYRHNMVVHTYPGSKNSVYTPLLGNASKYTGASLQSSPSDVFADTKEWVGKSAGAGVPWVVANDEQGAASTGIECDSADFNHNSVRKDVLWGNLMGGGAGIESYFGYQTCGGTQSDSDLTTEDYSTRDNWWNLCRHALEFFMVNGVPFWDMSNQDGLVSAGRCLAGGDTYVVYLPNGGTATLDLSAASGGFEVRWYDPRNGGGLQMGSVGSVVAGGVVALGNAPGATSSDWAVLITPAGLSVSAGPDQVVSLPPGGTQVTVSLDGTVSASGGVTYTSLWEKVSGPGTVSFTDATQVDTDAIITGLGSYILQLSAASPTNSDSDTMSVEVIPFSAMATNSYTPLHDVYIQGTSVTDNNDLRVEYNNRTTYIRFGVNDLPVGASVVSATLRMTEGSDPGDGTFRFWRGSHATWTEANITSANAPVTQDEVGTYSGTIVDGQTISVDVADLVTGNADYTVIVTHDSGGNDVAFASRETANGPELELVYELVPPPAPELTISLNGNQIAVAWTGAPFQLQETEDADGTYADILPSPSSPYLVNPVDPTTFYRLRWAP